MVQKESSISKEEARFQVLLAVRQSDIQIYLAYTIADSAALIAFTGIVWTLILSGIQTLFVLVTIFILFFSAIGGFIFVLKNGDKLGKARKALNDLLIQYS
jgi:hypothetical protein